MGYYDCHGDEHWIAADRANDNAARQEFDAEMRELDALNIPPNGDTSIITVLGFEFIVDWHRQAGKVILDSVSFTDCPEGDMRAILNQETLAAIAAEVTNDH